MQKSMIKAADGDLVRCLCECALNILKGNVRLTPPQKSKLTRHKHSLRQLASGKLKIGKKKKILQKGGFLSALLAPLIPVVGGLLGSIVGKLAGK